MISFQDATGSTSGVQVESRMRIEKLSVQTQKIVLTLRRGKNHYVFASCTCL